MGIEIHPALSQPAETAASDAERAEHVCDALAAYVEAMRQKQQTESLRDDARRAIVDYVRGLKGDRLTPERVLAMVKTVVGSPRSRVRVAEREPFMAEIVRWFIDSYYGARPATGGPRTSSVDISS